jgi:hypothetical protein
MAKKTDNNIKPAVPAATPEAFAPAKRIIKPAGKAKPTTKKAKAPALKAKRATKSVAPANPRYTREDVALRAYFISEKRHALGLPGDEHQDWIEAERQLLAESAKPKRAKKA